MTRQGLFWEQKEKVMGLYLDVLVQAHNPYTQEAKISLGYHVNPDQPGLHGETLY